MPEALSALKGCHAVTGCDRLSWDWKSDRRNMSPIFAYWA